MRHLIFALLLTAASASFAAPPLEETPLLAGRFNVPFATRVDVGQFDGDAAVDLLVIAQQRAEIWLGGSDGPSGPYGLADRLTMPGAVLDVATFDANDDGREDVVVLGDDAGDTIGVFLQQPAGAAPRFVRSVYRIGLEGAARLGRTRRVVTGDGYRDRLIVMGPSQPVRILESDRTGGLVAVATPAHPGGARAAVTLLADGDTDEDVLILGAPPQRLWLARGTGYVEQVLDGIDVDVDRASSLRVDLDADTIMDLVVVETDGDVSVHGSVPPAQAGAGPDWTDATATIPAPAGAGPAHEAMLFDITRPATAQDPLQLVIARRATSTLPGRLDVHPNQFGTVQFGAAVPVGDPGAGLQFLQTDPGDLHITLLAGNAMGGMRSYRIPGPPIGAGTTVVRWSDTTAQLPYVNLGPVDPDFITVTWSIQADRPMPRDTVFTVTQRGAMQQVLETFYVGFPEGRLSIERVLRMRRAAVSTLHLELPGPPGDVVVGTPDTRTFKLTENRACHDDCAGCNLYFGCPCETYQFDEYVDPVVRSAAEVAKGADEAAMLRRFRDQVLATSPKGKDYIRYYYTLSDEVIALMVTHPGFADVVGDAMQQWLPALGSLTDGDGSAVVTAGMADSLESIVALLSERADPASAGTFERELQRFDARAYVGQPMTMLRQHWEGLQSDRVFRAGFEP